jgi:hypothetical protein
MQLSLLLLLLLWSPGGTPPAWPGSRNWNSAKPSSARQPKPKGSRLNPGVSQAARSPVMCAAAAAGLLLLLLLLIW